MTLRRATLASIGLFTLAACATATDREHSDVYRDAIGVVDATTQTMVQGDYSSSAWISEDFDGTQTRELIANRLYFTVENRTKSGGWDGSVSHGGADHLRVPVDEVGAGAYACTAYHVEIDPSEDSAPSWWAGPKISVNWDSMEDPEAPGDWYENYVIEIGSQSPEEWERGMRSWIDIDLFAETEISGSRYKHYKVRYKDWWQFWSIRQEPRAAGAVNIRDILEAWQLNGLPGDLLVDGVKANIETHGPIKAQGQIAATFNAGGLRAETGQCEVPRLEVARPG